MIKVFRLCILKYQDELLLEMRLELSPSNLHSELHTWLPHPVGTFSIDVWVSRLEIFCGADLGYSVFKFFSLHLNSVIEIKIIWFYLSRGSAL